MAPPDSDASTVEEIKRLHELLYQKQRDLLAVPKAHRNHEACETIENKLAPLHCKLIQEDSAKVQFEDFADIDDGETKNMAGTADAQAGSNQVEDFGVGDGENSTEDWHRLAAEAEAVFQKIAAQHEGDASTITRAELINAHGGDFGDRP